MNMGPPAEERLEREEVTGLFRKLGLQEISEKDFNDYFYIVAGKKV